MESDPDIPTLAMTTGAFQTGTVLGGRYRVEASLGRGGMGEVWRAYDLRLCVDVALKSLLPELRLHADSHDALVREVRAAREVISPNVCRIFDLIEVDGRELLSMEFVDGSTLLETLRTRSPLPLSEARAIAVQFLAGLEAIHTAGLVHRDLKPENIMITRSSRVVIMDLGIARSLAGTKHGTVAGTPGYMAPEQARGDALTPSADLYSAGIVLAELAHPKRLEGSSHVEFLRAIRQDPSGLPDTAWKQALERCLAWEPEKRYGSAAALARVLEEATQRYTGAAERSPYPGLSSFTTADADSFFGRELEVEAMWRRLQRLHLLAVVGPSGAGKSSFLQAGLIPAKPEGWAYVSCTPGVSPFISLGQALARQFTDDRDVIGDLVRVQEPDIAVSLFHRWRQRKGAALLILDQFEELFTQNPPTVQKAFAELIGRLPLEADVHVLLSMRDDFLLRCQEHRALWPIFSELTPLGPLRGPDLRRAITLPALSCGYRFDDDTLVDEMVAQISEERGALPLLAFAASRLWEHRDRGRGLLTRNAYTQIGGVSGALAQHAEATYERVPPVQQPLVREMLRSLMTAERTRVAREREDLLSSFEDRVAAVQVLDTLINARLLTSFEVGSTAEDKTPHVRVEIIHESLLNAWPRLLHWQTQDTEGAQLRDQLRQAAQLWRDRGRPQDLLWTGTVFREFELWRERNPSRLTNMEEDFAREMAQRALRRRHRRRLAVGVTMAVLLSGLALVGTLWRQSEKAHTRAVAEANRAEASKLLTLAKTTLNPSDALAYAIASFELADVPETRRQAIRTLYQGPTRFAVSRLPGAWNPWTVEFSPDGQKLAIGWSVGNRTQILPASGGPAVDLVDSALAARIAQNIPSDGRALGWNIHSRFREGSREIAFGTDDRALRIYSVDPPRLLREFPFRGVPSPEYSKALRAWVVREMQTGERPRWVAISDGGQDLRELGRLGPVVADFTGPPPAFDPNDPRIATWSGRDVTLHELRNGSIGPGRIIGRHRGNVVIGRFNPQGDMLLTADDSSEVRVWSVKGLDAKPLLVSKGGSRPTGIAFDRNGRRVAVTSISGLFLFDLTLPSWLQPTVLEKDNWAFVPEFHPSGSWVLSSAHGQTVLAWPLSRPYARRIGDQWVAPSCFSPDGRWMAMATERTIELWSMEAPEVPPRTLVRFPSVTIVFMVFDAQSRTLFASGHTQVGDAVVGQAEPGTLFEISLETGRMRAWRDPPTGGTICIDPTGRFVTSSGRTSASSYEVIVDRRSGRSRTMTVPGSSDVRGVGFSSDGTFILSADSKLHVWNPATDDVRPLGLTVQWIFGRVERFVWMDQEGRVWVGDPTRKPQQAVAFPASGQEPVDGDVTIGNRVVLGYREGLMEIYDPGGAAPHLIPADGERATGMSVDPLGRWISTSSLPGVYLWPMPEGRPLYSQPREIFLATLQSLTNYRAVRDTSNVNGYSIQPGLFPGWKVPTW